MQIFSFPKTKDHEITITIVVEAEAKQDQKKYFFWCFENKKKH